VDDAAAEQLVAELRKFGSEATGVEVKASATSLPKSARETLSAFANTRGGVLLLGVSEGEGFGVTGVGDPAKIQADLASMCSEDLSPAIRAHVSLVSVEGRPLVVAEVAELPKHAKPCYVKSVGMHKGSYVRVGEGDRRLTSEEVGQLIADRGQPAFDREIVENATIDDLDSRSLRDYVERLRTVNPRLFGNEPTDVVLRLTGVMVRTPEGDRPTLAGVLALGRYPQQFFPQLNATFINYPTQTGVATPSGVRFLDNVSLDGPVPVIVSEALAAITRNMSRRAVIQGGGRRDFWDYPLEALREAIVNALVHRDLSPGSRGTKVQIEMYPDRLVVKNPGGLFGPSDETRLGEEGNSSARNAVLVRMLEDVEIPGEERTVCENRGSGIRNMIAALRSAGMGLPIFFDRITSFSVTLPNHALLDDDALEWLAAIGGEELRDSQCLALALMRRGEVLDNALYRKVTGVADSRIATYELQDLVARELVDQSGQRGGSKYSLSRFATGDAGSRRPRPNRRRQIVDFLALVGDASKTEIAERLRLNPKTVEHWLRKLRTEGVVDATERTRSRNTRYQLSPRGRQTSLFGDPEERART